MPGWVEAARFPRRCSKGSLEEGVRVTRGADGRPRLHGRIIEAGSSTRIVAGSQKHADKLRKRVKRRVEAEGKSVKITEQGHDQARPRITAEVSLDFVVWGPLVTSPQHALWFAQLPDDFGAAVCTGPTADA